MATATRKTSNGAGPSAKAKDMLEGTAREAKKASKPLAAGGVVAAAFAGGVMLGTKLGRKRKGGGAAALAGVAKAVSQLVDAGGDLRAAREQLEQLNRRSPVEVLLDGLTHRRGAHRREN